MTLEWPEQPESPLAVKQILTFTDRLKRRMEAFATAADALQQDVIDDADVRRLAQGGDEFGSIDGNWGLTAQILRQTTTYLDHFTLDLDRNLTALLRGEETVRLPTAYFATPPSRPVTMDAAVPVGELGTAENVSYLLQSNGIDTLERLTAVLRRSQVAGAEELTAFIEDRRIADMDDFYDLLESGEVPEGYLYRFTHVLYDASLNLFLREQPAPVLGELAHARMAQVLDGVTDALKLVDDMLDRAEREDIALIDRLEAALVEDAGMDGAAAREMTSLDGWREAIADFQGLCGEMQRFAAAALDRRYLLLTEGGNVLVEAMSEEGGRSRLVLDEDWKEHLPAYQSFGRGDNVRYLSEYQSGEELARAGEVSGMIVLKHPSYRYPGNEPAREATLSQLRRLAQTRNADLSDPYFSITDVIDGGPGFLAR